MGLIPKRGRRMEEHICQTCKYSEPMCGALACMGQKGMPYVRPRDGCDGWKSKKQTNGDKLRSMSDTNLACWLAAMMGVNPFDGTGNEYRKWLDWLKQQEE